MDHRQEEDSTFFYLLIKMLKNTRGNAQLDITQKPDAPRSEDKRTYETINIPVQKNLKAIPKPTIRQYRQYIRGDKQTGERAKEWGMERLIPTEIVSPTGDTEARSSGDARSVHMGQVGQIRAYVVEAYRPVLINLPKVPIQLDHRAHHAAQNHQHSRIDARAVAIYTLTQWTRAHSEIIRTTLQGLRQINNSNNDYYDPKMKAPEETLGFKFRVCKYNRHTREAEWDNSKSSPRERLRNR
eukprot:gene11780-24694_t